MTEGQQEKLEKDILHAVFVAEKEVAAFRLGLSVIGQHLESLGRALREHPEEVTPLPEPQNMYDYREGLNILEIGKKWFVFATNCVILNTS